MRERARDVEDDDLRSLGFGDRASCYMGLFFFFFLTFYFFFFWG